MNVLKSLGRVVSIPFYLMGSSLQTIYEDTFSHPCTTGMGVNQAYLAISGIALGTLGLYGLGKVSSSISFKASLFLISAGGFLIVESAVKNPVDTVLSITFILQFRGLQLLVPKAYVFYQQIAALQQQLALLQNVLQPNALQQHLALQQAALLQPLPNAPSPQSPKSLEDIPTEGG